MAHWTDAFKAKLEGLVRWSEPDRKWSFLVYPTGWDADEISMNPVTGNGRLLVEALAANGLPDCTYDMNRELLSVPNNDRHASGQVLLRTLQETFARYDGDTITWRMAD